MLYKSPARLIVVFALLLSQAQLAFAQEKSNGDTSVPTQKYSSQLVVFGSNDEIVSFLAQKGLSSTNIELIHAKINQDRTRSMSKIDVQSQTPIRVQPTNNPAGPSFYFLNCGWGRGAWVLFDVGLGPFISNFNGVRSSGAPIAVAINGGYCPDFVCTVWHEVSGYSDVRWMYHLAESPVFENYITGTCI